jgi:LEA14-like dessication related protein
MLKRFAFVCLIFLASCSGMKEVQCTGVKGFTVSRIDTKGIDGQVLLGVKNPNSFGFSIYKSEFDITYGGIYLGKAKLAKRVHIHKNAEETYEFHLTKDFKDINLLDVMKLLNGASLKNSIEVKGDLKVGKFLIKKKIAVDVKEKVKLN